MQNYARQMNETLLALQKKISCGKKKPSLLLHACCAPCSSAALDRLCDFFEITIFYYNPNIHPKKEYFRRLNELKNFLPKFFLENSSEENFQNEKKSSPPNLIESEYDANDFFSAVQAERDGLQNEAERGTRCSRCYELRMKKAFEFAKKNGFDFWTTTLSASPHKDAQKINEIGFAFERQFFKEKNSLSENFFSPKFLCADFKKQNGFLRSLELSKKFGLYRQDYCGCVYSIENSAKKIEGEFREMCEEEISCVLDLMSPFVKSGLLLPRNFSDLKSQRKNFIVYEAEKKIRACAALKKYDEKTGGIQAEIYSVAVEEKFANKGVGPKMIDILLERAKTLGAKSVFILTTQAGAWFSKLGFVPDTLDSIPAERLAIWSAERGSKVFRKQV